jgi:hypothetical protein
LDRRNVSLAPLYLKTKEEGFKTDDDKVKKKVVILVLYRWKEPWSKWPICPIFNPALYKKQYCSCEVFQFAGDREKPVSKRAYATAVRLACGPYSE